MRYRGFELKPTEKHFPHAIVVRGVGIFRDDQCLAYAADMDLAKRTVDERLRRGLWKDPTAQEVKNQEATI